VPRASFNLTFNSHHNLQLSHIIADQPGTSSSGHKQRRSSLRIRLEIESARGETLIGRGSQRGRLVGIGIIKSRRNILRPFLSLHHNT
jgi:hypothetical protein